jgi:Haemolysin XhlA
MGNEVDRLVELIEGNVNSRQTDIERRVGVLETDNATNKSNIGHQQKQLDAIENNSIWTLRLIIGALVTGAVGGVITLIIRLAFKA